jgi:glutathione S-transferase
MVDLVLPIFDWVPEKPPGCLHDIRVRWALEEAGLPYRDESTPFRTRSAGISCASPSAKCRG